MVGKMIACGAVAFLLRQAAYCRRQESLLGIVFSADVFRCKIQISIIQADIIMRITDYHAKYYARELTKRCPSDSIEKLAPSLLDARVDLNLHQVEAAIFAFKSPFSTGAILADKVGLGKTIEAGIVLSQMWAERNRKILVVVPSSLRKQWNQELSDKFFLPSEILETKPFNERIKAGIANPFRQDVIVICSYHFACNAEQITRDDAIAIAQP
jgi:hypothetical protein